MRCLIAFCTRTDALPAAAATPRRCARQCPHLHSTIATAATQVRVRGAIGLPVRSDAECSVLCDRHFSFLCTAFESDGRQCVLLTRCDSDGSSGAHHEDGSSRSYRRVAVLQAMNGSSLRTEGVLPPPYGQSPGAQAGEGLRWPGEYDIAALARAEAAARDGRGTAEETDELSEMRRLIGAVAVVQARLLAAALARPA